MAADRASGDRDRLDLVLVHGGYHGAWVWEPLLAPLGRRDVRALAVDLPGRGAHPAPLAEVTVASSAASVAADVAAAGLGPVAVVAHSLGGVTAPAIADRLGDQARALVFISCLIAPDGKSTFDGFPPDLRARADATLHVEDGAESDIDLEHHRAMLANDLDEAQTQWVLDRVVPDSLNFFTDRVDWGTAASLPCHYVKLLRDQTLPPAMQEVMIGLLPEGTIVHEIDAGHEVMVSQPEALAAVLAEV